jgi:hypothetical protein
VGQPQIVTIALLALGIPFSLFRLWLIWWRGECRECGKARSACDCLAREPGL